MTSTRICRSLSQLSNPTLKAASGTKPLFRQTTFTPHIAKRAMASAMSKRLEGKTIVITGASSGIGKSTG